MTPPLRIVVVGGGISGLAAAYDLLRSAPDAVEVHLFEATRRLGGKLQTETRSGFTLELGPDAFLSTKPGAVQLCRELGLEDELIGTNPSRRAVYILHRGELRPLPDGLHMMVPTSVRGLLRTPLLSWSGKIRAALEPRVPPKTHGSEESLRQFVSRRFGSELYKHVLEPLMSGIYAGDGSRLSVQATFPMLAAAERWHGSVALGARVMKAQRARLETAGGRVPESLFLAPKDGTRALVQALTARLKWAEVHVGTQVIAIEASGHGFQLSTDHGRSYAATAVILAVPSDAAAAALRGLDEDLASALDDIEYVSTVTVNLAYREGDLSRQLDGYGYLVPQVEGRPALACTWTSTKFSHRAPPDHALLRLFFGRAGGDDWIAKSDSQVIEAARAEVASTLGEHAPPVVARVQRWPRGIPQYNLGHRARTQSIERLSRRHPGLALAGAAYHGVGIPDCIESGRRAARQVLSHLRQPGATEPAPI